MNRALAMVVCLTISGCATGPDQDRTINLARVAAPPRPGVDVLVLPITGTAVAGTCVPYGSYLVASRHVAHEWAHVSPSQELVFRIASGGDPRVRGFTKFEEVGEDWIVVKTRFRYEQPALVDPGYTVRVGETVWLVGWNHLSDSNDALVLVREGRVVGAASPKLGPNVVTIDFGEPSLPLGASGGAVVAYDRNRSRYVIFAIYQGETKRQHPHGLAVRWTLP